MRGVRDSGESAGSDEEGPHEVGGGRLPDLSVAFAAGYERVGAQTDSQILDMVGKRVDVGDPMAIYNLGTKYDFGRYGLEKDVTKAVELYERAAELGVKEAHYNLGVLYANGAGVEKDMAKAMRHYEAAVMCGHVPARFNLGNIEGKAGNHVIALQHMMISAKLGHEYSLNTVKRMFMAGLATKDEYAASLRGYQNAIKDMSSSDRDEAKALGFRKPNTCNLSWTCKSVPPGRWDLELVDCISPAG
ncbi:hypothetical protein THAOC_34716, partial [Thalassiosira oceanica]